jgi:SAM-dependent methyltransferase
MSVEFTGERVIPGRVDADLLNEHLARYAFAARLARGKRVLDAGCGAGYGAAELAESALSVVGADIAAEAVAFARAHYRLPYLEFEQASCTALPHPDAAFDLVVAFEVIEHLPGWRDFLLEARRVLAPTGQFIVSTPNKLYYAESRRRAGANQFHAPEWRSVRCRREKRAEPPRCAWMAAMRHPRIRTSSWLSARTGRRPAIRRSSMFPARRTCCARERRTSRYSKTSCGGRRIGWKMPKGIWRI